MRGLNRTAVLLPRSRRRARSCFAFGLFFLPRSRRRARSCFTSGLFIFFFSFVGDYIQTSADDDPRMMSSSANYKPFLSSFRHMPPQESFVKSAN